MILYIIDTLFFMQVIYYEIAVAALPHMQCMHISMRILRSHAFDTCIVLYRRPPARPNKDSFARVLRA